MKQFLQNISDWNSFIGAQAQLGKKEKGDSFEDLVFYYLQIHPIYYTQLADVWRLRDVPADARRKLNLPDTDEGIDLVARTKEGAYWAIQCKFR